MKTTTSQNRSHQSGRSAFSLVELMVVIVVIGILMAMLLPALGGARRRVQIAAAVNEMKVIEKGLEDFKLKFGTYPPSSIVLYERGASAGDPDWAADTSTPGVANQAQRDARRLKAIAVINQIWPNFDFSVNRDINGDGDADDALVLDGAECLVFFLGGMYNTLDSSDGIIVDRDGSAGTGTGAVTTWAPIGFSSNPSNPFLYGVGNRIGPFIEFSNLDRVVDFDNDTMPELLDTLPSQAVPMIYLSSYDGRGYRLSDIPSYGPSGYYTKTPGTNGTPYKEKTFQILSPGFDIEYGTGGYYDGDSISSSGPNGATRSGTERDNITNFKGGELD